MFPSLTRICALLVLGLALVQAAWILALPPFRGIDEFDHAYRAAAVSGGEWIASGETAKQGRGTLVTVPDRIVQDAAPVCWDYDYTGPDNCRPVDRIDDDRVKVASAAASYNPAFYWVVGAPSRWLEGAYALYAMRAVAAAICAGFFFLGVWSIAHSTTSPWPLLAILATITPMWTFSTILPAPNGTEMFSALALWSVLFGLAAPQGSESIDRTLVRIAAICVVPLLVVRSIGPLWLALIACIALPLIGLPQAKAIWARLRWQVWAVGALIFLTTSVAVLWTVTMDTNALESESVKSRNPLLGAIEQVPLWFLQSIAAFPTRSEPAPPAVYAAGGLLLCGFVGAGILVAKRRERLILATAIGLWGAVPLVFTTLTYSTAGPIWQGRYAFPFAAGIVLLAGLALERRMEIVRWIGPAWGGVVLLQSVAHTASVVKVHKTELLASPLAGDSRWITTPTWFIAGLMLAGMGAWGWAGLSIIRRSALERPLERALRNDAAND